DSIFETLPSGWRERLVPIPETGSSALDPHDLAAVKLLVGRPKDLELVRQLHLRARIDPKLVKERLASIQMDERGITKAGNHLRQVFGMDS
ncbi:MAG TPA: hypothetical protein PLA50_18910, partial [Bacteroidia bacterium]|nr:hypothetical protein [Bacteroidia bacterium]